MTARRHARHLRRRQPILTRAVLDEAAALTLAARGCQCEVTYRLAHEHGFPVLRFEHEQWCPAVAPTRPTDHGGDQ
jgi:hypothetical protein